MHRKFHPCCVQPPLHLTLDARITSKLYLPVGNNGPDIDTVRAIRLYLCTLIQRAFKPITLPLLLGMHEDLPAISSPPNIFDPGSPIFAVILSQCWIRYYWKNKRLKISNKVSSSNCLLKFIGLIFGILADPTFKPISSPPNISIRVQLSVIFVVIS